MRKALFLSLFLFPRPASAAEFSIVSWNVQTFGSVSHERQRACRAAYEAVISTSVYMLAVQEVANERGLRTLRGLLPDGPPEWAASFDDTPDSQDNALLFRESRVAVMRTGFLFADPVLGRPDRRRAAHPARWAHVRVDDFDFTLVTVHLAFKGGDANAARREFFALLDWLSEYLSDPNSDPDVIVAGDFNLPSEKGKRLSRRGGEAGWFTLESLIREHGKLAAGKNRLSVLVDEPTSRSQGRPVNNYDHFLVSRDVFEEFLSAGRGPVEAIERAQKRWGAQVSDHYPIAARFRSRGRGVAPDFKLVAAGEGGRFAGR